MGSEVQSSEASLPYELLALEAALAAHTKGLEADTAKLEGQAKPSLEHLLLSVRPCHTKLLYQASAHGRPYSVSLAHGPGLLSFCHAGVKLMPKIRIPTCTGKADALASGRYSTSRLQLRNVAWPAPARECQAPHHVPVMIK